MNPRLVAVSGPQQGSIFPLSGDSMSIGRDIPIRERILQHGDRIEFGESVFLFLLAENESPAGSPLFEDGMGAIPTTRLLHCFSYTDRPIENFPA